MTTPLKPKPKSHRKCPKEEPSHYPAGRRSIKRWQDIIMRLHMRILEVEDDDEIN